VVATINAQKGETGVSATTSGTQLKLGSVDYGSDAFVSVSALSGDAAIVASAQVAKKSGTNATITVNGKAASVSGTEFFYSSGSTSLSATLVDNTVGARTITVTGKGGATFQIGTNVTSKAVIGIGDINSSDLGQSGVGHLSDLASGGSASLASDPGKAAIIARKAAMQVATAAARIGGFSKYAIESSTNSLNVLKETLTASISSIQDTDYAAETSRLDRQNLLATAGLSLLGVMSSQQRTVLSLLSST
jgi:flagellin